jgi:hypothetical protein
MKSQIISLLITSSVILGGQSLLAQNKITLSHLGAPTFYTNMTTAITAAVNGDTLYLPGGPIMPTASDITVNKAVHIIGAGHYPDSTAATGRTIITTLRFLTGCGGGSIQGCSVTNLYIGYAASQNITAFSVTRCLIDLFRIGSDNISTIDNINVTDNIFTGDFYINNSYPNVLISRNIFNDGGRSGQGLFIKNNIFYDNVGYSSYGVFEGFNSCVFENNVIIPFGNTTMNINSSNSQYIRNYFVFPSITSWGSNAQQNSLLGQTLPLTFENVTGNAFNYNYNYHLKATSPGKNYGTDGTDVGIYGTIAPYKDGAVPFNPHIMTRNISGQTTPQGILNVNISVSAQDR